MKNFAKKKAPAAAEVPAAKPRKKPGPKPGPLHDVPRHKRRVLAAEKKKAEEEAARAAKAAEKRREANRKKIARFTAALEGGAKHKELLAAYNWTWREFNALLKENPDLRDEYEAVKANVRELWELHEEEVLHGQITGDDPHEELTAKGAVVMVHSPDPAILQRRYELRHPAEKDGAAADAADYTAILKRVNAASAAAED